MLPFLKKFRKEIQKLENVSSEFSPPGFWYSTGNYALNRALSGSYFKAIPQGRLTAFVGPSAAGKSYISCNVIREAQRQGAICLVIDSENALDPKFMSRAGINVNDDNFSYVQVVTIQNVTSVVSEFLTGYEKEYGKFNKEAPKLFIVLDSLGNCLTDSENEKFEQGRQTGDQGQSAKNKKHLLRTLVSRLARCNATFVFTDQVYPADPMAGDGLWAVTNGVKYSASQIALLTKLKLKEGTEIAGIRMRIETYKSRFVKPGTRIEVEIPFDEGLTPTAGLIESLEADGVITKDGFGWLVDLEGKEIKFKKSTLTEELALKILTTNPKIIAIEKKFTDLEENDLFLPEASTEVVDTSTGEIIELGDLGTPDIKIDADADE
jgi:recombination protein RecA